MMKKILATLLAMMMLAMPAAGLAETTMNDDLFATALNAGRRISFDVTLSDIATEFSGEPAIDQVIFDILNALKITGYVQGDEVYYSIGMTQESGAVSDLLTMGVATAGDDTYLLSNLIGGTIVVGQDEVQPLLERLIDMMVTMDAMTEREAAQIKAELGELFAALNVEKAATASLESIDFTTLDFSAILAVAETVMGKVTVDEMDVLPKNCDTPASMVSITLTPEEMKALIASLFQFLKDNPALSEAIASEISFDEVIAPQFSGVSGETTDFMGFIDMMLAELADAELYRGDTVVKIWLDEAGEPVAISIVAPVEGGEMTLNSNRLTMNDVVLNSVVFAFPGGDVSVDVVEKGNEVSVSFAVAENGETRIAVKADYTDRSAENLIANDLVMDMTITDVTLTSSYAYSDVAYSNSEEVEEINIGVRATRDTVVDGIDFVTNASVTVVVEGKEYLTINITMKSEEAGASIMTGDVVRPAELSDADFANWFVSAFSALYAWLQNALFSMPSSLFNLMNTGF